MSNVRRVEKDDRTFDAPSGSEDSPPPLPRETDFYEVLDQRIRLHLDHLHHHGASGSHVEKAKLHLTFLCTVLLEERLRRVEPGNDFPSSWEFSDW